jgi:methylmalonyl-CoA/ethylmalonyl-CoA epimerase
MKIKRVHHLTIATRDAPAARATFESLLGVEASDAEAIPAFGVSAVQLALGDTALEIVSPLDTESAVMRFLERKGEGFYNLALEVEDLDAAVAELAARGVRVSEPVEPGPGLRSAFITMAATHGLSIQLLEVASASSAATEGSPPAPAPPEPEAEREAPAAARQEPPPPVLPPAPEPSGEHAADAATLAAGEERPDAESAGAPKPLDLTPDEWSDLD